MKKILCFSMVFMLAALLVVPCFAAETNAAPSDPVDWFGSSTGPYTCTTSDYAAVRTFLENNSVTTDESTWLPVSSCSLVKGGTSYDGYTSLGLYNSTNCGLKKTGSVNFFSADDIFTLTFTIDDLSGLDTTGLSFVGSGSDGFVDSGVSDALTELSIIVSAILSNQYILIAIGLAVAVPLVAWGISKIKSLVKGY